MTSFLIFLDFDGVLHDVFGKMPVFTHIPAMVEALAGFPDAKLVITSSWRDHTDIARLRLLIGELGPRLVGVTPRVKNCRQFVRQREIEAWLQGRPEFNQWLALDDMPDLFEPGTSHLLLCDPRTGLDQSVLTTLIARLEAHSLLISSSRLAASELQSDPDMLNPSNKTESIASLKGVLRKPDSPVSIDAMRMDATVGGIKARGRYSLQELLNDIPVGTRFEEWDIGHPVGREFGADNARFMRALQCAYAVFASVLQATQWMTENNAELDGTPLHIATESEEGCARVARTLLNIAKQKNALHGVHLNGKLPGA